ncbi:mRNA-binding protein RRP12 Ecym_7314 [Eremothecium cymbalariae DBVPG|uniref:Uncharacterized protein n=1 Tax=Eremothecium cymbalariae (strain CBS 270.75 / DBVPG 7215 / KCTC 17166 / NRRL Y-17582) TaxID=931890 RepID=G8JWD4_ERECY|nr:hypothetical protein Ecym_7314 [Eremothecium cymbalariae DBVPG\
MDSEQVTQSLELEERLSRIRSQCNSKLDNQKHIAIILSAVEENMDEQQATNKNFVSYLISFMSLLDQSIDATTNQIQDVQLASSSTYLLDLLFQFTQKKILRSKFSELLMKIAPCITDERATPPLIRSAIGCLESLLIAQDAQAWNNTQQLAVNPVRGLSGLLELSLDARSKIRKRAQDGISKILSNPPPSPSTEHIAAPIIANFAVKALASILDEASNISNKKLRAMGGSEDLNSRVIRVLKLINTITSTNQWPSQLTEQLCDLLLEVSRSSNQYLVSNAFNCFESLFKSMAESSVSSGLAEDKFLKVIDIIFSMKPSNTDSHLAVPWIAVIAKGVTTYAFHQPMKCLIKLPEIFNIMTFYLSSETPEVYFNTAQCLITLLTDAVKDELLLYPPAVTTEVYESVDEVISKLAEIFTGYLSINFTHCSKDVLNVLSVAFKKFKHRCNPDFIKPLEIVGNWRTNEENSLDFKNEAEQVIGSAIQGMGPEVVLGAIPLNLENQSDSRPGRAWLLPIIRDNTRKSKLSVFTKQLMPLIQFFESKYDNLDSASVQLRLLQTIVHQLWSTLPHFCDLPSDLREVFTDQFAADLSSAMYSKVELRTIICNSLKQLVESNMLYARDGTTPDVLLEQQFPISEAEKNLEYLSTKASNILAVLFNIYTQTTPNSRSYTLETIEAYLRIASPRDLSKTFDNVCALLKDAMEKESVAQKNMNQNKMSATLLDLIVVMTKFIPESSYGALFSIFNTIVNSPDSLTQKRAYRIITNLSQLERGSEAVLGYLSDIEKVMIESAQTVQTASKASRLAAIKILITLLPPDHLSFIVQLVAEVILCCKDVNEKSREAAFGTLITMCTKMQDSTGIVKLSQIPGYDTSSPDQPSSVTEFFKIMSAGLIGNSQHMVSATITAYSCLVFEFKNHLEPQVLTDIYDTIELYLTSNSREIVKSTIGFCKVCCLSLPDEFMRPKIPALIPKLLRWSHEHTGHFKSRVKHIIERLIRRFGYDFIEANFPEEDKRLLANIRKIRNRNKRKAEEEEGEEGVSNMSMPSTKSSRFMSAVDEALYDSSDEDDENEKEEDMENGKKGTKRYIVESNGDPLDLLDSQTLAHISSQKPKKISNHGQNKKFSNNGILSFDNEGKLVVKGKEEIEDEDPLKSINSGIDAYLEALKSGPIKGQKGRLKYKRDNKGTDGISDDDEPIPSNSSINSRKHNKVGKKKGMYKNKRKF